MSPRERENTALAHYDEIRAEFAIRDRLRMMAAEEREMERAMKAFEEDADQAKRYIKDEWRRECWGHEPEHPPAWEPEVRPRTLAELANGSPAGSRRGGRGARSRSSRLPSARG
jgi:hypothetical protein